MKLLDLSVIHGIHEIPLQFKVKRMVNGGYVGRDLKAVKAHIEELQREGISPPPSVPMVFPVLSHNITTASRIEVVGSMTSGEAEFVLLLDGKNVFVGVGSDHTDRDIERNSIVKSKLVCQNVLSSKVWRYEEVESYWDELLIRSWTKATEGDEWVLYQKALLRTIISASQIMDLVRSKLKDDQTDGLVIFSGTVPTLTGEMIFGSAFRAELFDERLGRSLICEYQVLKLNYIEGMET
jgi:hypothetical protein